MGVDGLLGVGPVACCRVDGSDKTKAIKHAHEDAGFVWCVGFGGDCPDERREGLDPACVPGIVFLCQLRVLGGSRPERNPHFPFQLTGFVEG